MSALEAVADDERQFDAASLESVRQLVLGYYEALNSQNLDALEILISESVACDTQLAERLVGRRELISFIRESNARCREHVFDIHVMVSPDGRHAAAEFTVLGFPLAGDRGDSDVASGQTYRLPGGTFFEISDSRVVRISSYGECGRLSPGALAAPQFSP